MVDLYTPRPFGREEKRRAIAELLGQTVPDRDFYLLIVGAVALAVGAIFLDSIAVLIASMIVAPLAYPILGLGLGLVVGDSRLIVRTFGMLCLAFIIAIVLAFLATLLFGQVRVDPFLVSFGGNRLVATAIAVIAGAIAAYGFIRPKVGGAMTGIGIAVSLMPPLAATGVEVATGDMALATEAFVLFILNVVGILIASGVVFFTVRIAVGLPAAVID